MSTTSMPRQLRVGRDQDINLVLSKLSSARWRCPLALATMDGIGIGSLDTSSLS